ncbi:Ribonuclease TUDOR 1 [Linum perenne]
MWLDFLLILAVEMATSTAGSTGWYKGRVKAVPSGDCLVIMAITTAKPGPPPEKTITLSSLMAPKLARRGGVDEPFAWDSREFLRKLCVGKEVTFKVDYAVPSIGREFGSVFLGDKNVAVLVVSQGWAKVREQGSQKGEASPFLAELLQLEEQAKEQGLGKWNKNSDAAEASIRYLPPSAIGDPSNFNANDFVSANKGSPIECIVEQVRDGSTIRVYLLPDFQFVQVFVAGVQSPSVGRRAPVEPFKVTETTSNEPNGDTSKTQAPLNLAEKLLVPTKASEVAPDPFAVDAKHFTELRVLNRDVRFVVEACDKYSNLIGSVYYPDGDTAKDLGLELLENGLAKYVEWSARNLEEDARRKLKAAELQSKKSRLRMFTNYVPPTSNSKAIHDQKFTGKVVEIVSGDCIIVADDSVPLGSPLAERRVYLSSIKCPKMVGPREKPDLPDREAKESTATRKPELPDREAKESMITRKPEPYAREVKEFLRTRLLGKQVNVQMEYARRTDAPSGATGPVEARVMEFGTVFLSSDTKGDGDEASGVPPSAAGQQGGVNVAELILSRGLGRVANHKDFEERSNFYDALLAAELRATSSKKGLHSKKEPPVMHITDLTTVSAKKKAKDFLPFLQRGRRIAAVVEYVLSGHRFKLLIPKETCTIVFSFSGVRCPGRNELYADEAIAVMRRRIMQREVEIEVETVDRNGTFLGSLWESRTNMATVLLEAGLAKLQKAFGNDSIPDVHLLERAEQSAKRQKLKIWENYVEGEEVSNGAPTMDGKQKEVLKVVVTEVLGGGKLYIQTVGDQRVASIQQQLASLNLQEAPILGAFNPKKGDMVLAQFSADNSWNRAIIVNGPRGAVQSVKDKFEVFYIDYGNQEEVPYAHLRPVDPSVSTAPGLAQLCSLAYIKVPDWDEDCGPEAADFLSANTLSSLKEFRAKIEDKDLSGGKVKGQGTGPILIVTLVAVDAEISVNAALVQARLARIEKRRKWDSKERQVALDNLEKFQDEARSGRRGMWVYGDVQSDEEDEGANQARKAGGGRGGGR